MTHPLILSALDGTKPGTADRDAAILREITTRSAAQHEFKPGDLVVSRWPRWGCDHASRAAACVFIRYLPDRKLGLDYLANPTLLDLDHPNAAAEYDCVLGVLHKSPDDKLAVFAKHLADSREFQPLQETGT